MEFLVALLICLLSAYLGGGIAKKFGFPRVVGQVVSGLIIGLPFLKELIVSPQFYTSLSDISSIGIVLLFFFTGLKISVKRFKKNAKRAVSVSFFSTFVPLLAGLVFAQFLGFNLLTSLVIGIVLAVSSQAIAIDLLEELKMLKSNVGFEIIATGSIDDLFEFFLIGIILSAFYLQTTQLGISGLLLNLVAFLVLIFFFRFWVIPFILRRFQKTSKDNSPFFSEAIFIALLLAALADYLGISAFLGAFIAGLLVRHILLDTKDKSVWEEHQIAKIIHTFAFGFFIPLFFVFVGLNISVINILHNLPLTLTLLFLAIGGTILGTTIGVVANKGKTKDGIIEGLGVSAKGDMELVIANLALLNGIIDSMLYTCIVLMAVISTIVVPPLFKYFSQKWGYAK